MARLRALLMALWFAVAFLGASGPKPCMGNGAGQACSAAACACTLACSCHGAHEQERVGAQPWGLSHCGSVDRPVCRDGLGALAACHGAQSPAHFGYGQEPGPALLALPDAGWPAQALAPPPVRAPASARARPWPLNPPPPEA